MQTIKFVVQLCSELHVQPVPLIKNVANSFTDYTNIHFASEFQQKILSGK
jgi:hypothetical protein